MLSFASDYIKGAHPKILERLLDLNNEALSGYGDDRYSNMARQKIAQACLCPQAQIYFLVGGTQTNATVISALLNLTEGVICASTGHINTHEAGAIEYTGHKVLPLESNDGKIDPNKLQSYLEDFYADDNHLHMVAPKLVYLSHPTEYGTIYSKKELLTIKEICNQYQIPLYMDGARLGYALASDESDLDLSDIASICDVFYIGGTKVGTLCGEAVVFPKGDAPYNFFSIVKQHGALLAKGALLGIQFDTLFTDDLYLKISKHAIEKSNQLKALLKAKGYQFYINSPTNQQFVIIANSKLKEIKQSVDYGFWEKFDNEHSVVRFATSWSTTDEDIELLTKIL